VPDAVTHYFRYTTDDVSDTSPSWVDASDLVRGFDINRGRSNELSRVDPGTARILLDNRGRDFDPVANPLIRPMNRWWLQVVHPGGTDDLFFGYAESYQQEWPGAGGRDAVCVVHLVDDFKLLALDKLPTTDPPRDTYSEVVLFDRPAAYWPMNVTTADSTAGQPDVVGSASLYPSGISSWLFGGAILGDEQTLYKGSYLFATSFMQTKGIANAGESGDFGGLSEFTAELWFRRGAGSLGAETNILRGPLSGGNDTWRINFSTTGKFMAIARNSGGTTYTVTGTTTPTATAVGDAGPWYHVIATITGGNLRLYVNGVSEGTPVAFSGSFGTMDAGSTVIVGSGASAYDFGVDDVACYRYGLATDRITAHYVAGSARGFARAQNPGDRIEDILDAAGSLAARSIRTGTREMIGSYMRGQSPLDEIRKAELAENVDAVFFIAKDGTVTFLDDGHRSVSPWSSVQATFNDDGTGLPYVDITVDYSESFLSNEIVVNKFGGELVTDDDTTSIDEYFKRTMSLGELPITTDGDVTTIAAALLAKYKDPMTRVTGLSLTTGHAGIAAAVFPLEIGDRIRVQRTPPQGDEILYPSTSLYPSTTLYPTSGQIDQTLFIQKIQVTGAAQSPYWNITLGVSPL
jgi:hypothetical protein